VIPFSDPLTRYRPTPAQDGQGGWTETLGTGTTIYAALKFHENTTTATVDAFEDIAPGDIVATADAAQYRVSVVTQTPGARWKTLQLERRQRPVSP
jgi:uncharacterized protein (DUF736 family)